MKSNGRIKVCITGTHDMSFFGDEQEDYETIYGCLVVPEDDFIIRNLLDHKVVNGEVVFSRAAGE